MKKTTTVSINKTVYHINHSDTKQVKESVETLKKMRLSEMLEIKQKIPKILSQNFKIECPKLQRLYSIYMFCNMGYEKTEIASIFGRRRNSMYNILTKVDGYLDIDEKRGGDMRKKIKEIAKKLTT